MTDPGLIQAAREALAAGETTAAGLPSVSALEKRLGRDVTAAERDAAFEEITREADGAEPAAEAVPVGEAEEKTMPEETQALVYVGPTLVRDYPVTHLQGFRNGALPAPLAKTVAADKNLARLFVPLDQMAQARKDVRDTSSVLGKAFARVAQAYRTKGGK